MPPLGALIGRARLAARRRSERTRIKTRVKTSLTSSGMRRPGVAAVVGAGLLAVGAMGASAAPVSDEFEGSSLDESVWSVVDPVGGGEVSVSDGAPRLRVPGGVSHDAWTPNESLRIVQDADDADLSVEVGFESNPTQRFLDQGILIEEAGGDFLRFDIYSNGNNTIGYAASSSDEEGFEEKFEIIVRTAGPHPLRVTRDGDRWLQELSTDGATWEPLANFTHEMKVDSLGAYAGNFETVGPAPAYTAVVDYVRVANDEPGPGTCAVDLTARDWQGFRGGRMTEHNDALAFSSGRTPISGAYTRIRGDDRSDARTATVTVDVDALAQSRRARTYLMAYNGRWHRRIASLDAVAGGGERSFRVRMANLGAVKIVTLGGPRAGVDRFSINRLELASSRCASETEV